MRAKDQPEVEERAFTVSKVFLSVIVIRLIIQDQLRLVLKKCYRLMKTSFYVPLNHTLMYHSRQELKKFRNPAGNL